MIAALPMYDFPELREATDAFWGALAKALVAEGIENVPLHLTRDVEHHELWRNPGLLFGQACEYPFAKSFRDSLRLVATPHYSAQGCDDQFYRSAIVVRTDDAAESLSDLRNRRCVINEADSNSGMNLFRAAIAPVSGGSRFFESVRVSGAHQRSVELLVASEADVTAVDCVTFAHLQRLSPALTAKVRILSFSPQSPSLPFVTARSTSDSTLASIRSALAKVFADPSLAPTRECLFLAGVDLSPDESCARVLQLEREAAQLQYPVLE